MASTSAPGGDDRPGEALARITTEIVRLNSEKDSHGNDPPEIPG